MSFEITEAFVKQFNTTVIHLSQQQGSRLQNMVRRVDQKGKSQFFDRIGPVTASKKTARHSDTPLIDTPHSRRRVTLSDYEHADLIDDADKVRLLIDPTSDYVKTFMWAFGRAKDDEIIAAADGVAYAGEEGGTSVAHPNSQKLAAVSAGAGSGLNVQVLRRVKKLFGENDVDEAIKVHFAHTAEGLEDLLAETEVTSSDFNTVRALVRGEINEFLGMDYVRTQRLGTQSGALSFDVTAGTVGAGAGNANGYTKNIAWAEDGLLLSMGADVISDVGPRRDKSMSTQVFMRMSIGSTRLEEEKVVIVFSNEA